MAAGSHQVTHPQAANQPSANRMKKISAPWSRKRPAMLAQRKRRASQPSSTSLPTMAANSSAALQRVAGAPTAAARWQQNTNAGAPTTRVSVTRLGQVNRGTTGVLAARANFVTRRMYGTIHATLQPPRRCRTP